MDPLSVAAGLAGLLSLAYQLVELCSKYSNGSSKGQLYDFIFELTALTDVLKQLEQFFNTPNSPSHFSNVSVLLSTNTRCSSKLYGLQKKLQRTLNETNVIKRVVDKVLNPLTESEHREAIGDIHRYSQIFSFALSIEGCSLLSKSSNEVVASLKEQAQQLNETKLKCAAIPDLASQIEASLNKLSSLQAIIRDLADQSAVISSISKDVTELKTESKNQERRREDEYRRDVLSWLSPVSFEARQRQISESHQEGTGSWFLEHATFQKWRDSKGSVLWSAGIPGAGKTFMASRVVDFLRSLNTLQDDIPVAFIYADYKEHYQQNTQHLLSSVTRQLATQNSVIMDVVLSRYQEHVTRSSGAKFAPLSWLEHVNLLQNLSAYIDKAYVVIDAVDEIPSLDNGKDVRTDLLNTLAQLPCLSLFCTSRPHIDASFHFSGALRLDIEATDADLRTYMEARISASRRLASFVFKNNSLGDRIVNTITTKASGMFLLARLQIDQLMSAITPRQVLDMLNTMSNRLYDMYERTLARIRSQSDTEANLGIRAISWAAFVKRPLSVSEFIHALSIEPRDQSLDENSLIDIQIILEACGGLLQLQPASLEADVSNGPFQNEETVGFVHYTMQEYMGTQAVAEESHRDIATTCLRYLCLDNFRAKDGGSSRHARVHYPFLAYAAPFWPAHAKGIEDVLQVDLMKAIISPKYAGFTSNWLRFALREYVGNVHAKLPLGFAAAAIAIHGATALLRMLLDAGVQVNVRFRGKHTPFGVALSYGRQECLDLLFAGGLGQDAEMNRSWTSTIFNECRENKALDLFERLIVQNLEVIKNSDHTETQVWQGRSLLRNTAPPLLSSVISVSETGLVKRLLEVGWNPNLTYASASTPTGSQFEGTLAWNSMLHVAIKMNSMELVQILLAAGSDPNGSSGLISPLDEAIKLSNRAMVEKLVDAGANVNTPGFQLQLSDDSMLRRMIDRHNLSIFKKLLESCGSASVSIRNHKSLKARLLGPAPRNGRSYTPRYTPPPPGYYSIKPHNYYGYYTPRVTTSPYRSRARYTSIGMNHYPYSEYSYPPYADQYDIFEPNSYSHRNRSSYTWHQYTERQTYYYTPESSLEDLICYAVAEITNLTSSALDQETSIAQLNRNGIIPFTGRERLLYAAICRGVTHLPKPLFTSFQESDEKPAWLRLSIESGNLGATKQLIESNLIPANSSGFETSLMTAIKYRQPSIMEYLLRKDAKPNSSFVRFALELYRLILGFAAGVPRAWEILHLLQSLPEDNDGPVRTYHWLTCDKLMYLGRFLGAKDLEVLREAIVAGIRPIDLSLLRQYAYKVLLEPRYSSDRTMAIRLEEVLDDEDFHWKDYLAKLRGPISNAELRMPQALGDKEIEEFQRFMSDVTSHHVVDESAAQPVQPVAEDRLIAFERGNTKSDTKLQAPSPVSKLQQSCYVDAGVKPPTKLQYVIEEAEAMDVDDEPPSEEVKDNTTQVKDVNVD